MNLETITDTQSWYKILLLNGFNLVRVKQNLHMRRRIDQKLYKQTTRWSLGKRVKFDRGVTALQHLIDPRQMASLKEPFDESKKVNVNSSSFL